MSDVDLSIALSVPFHNHFYKHMQDLFTISKIAIKEKKYLIFSTCSVPSDQATSSHGLQGSGLSVGALCCPN